jgi:hypothetical protein
VLDRGSFLTTAGRTAIGGVLVDGRLVGHVNVLRCFNKTIFYIIHELLSVVDDLLFGLLMGFDI